MAPHTALDELHQAECRQVDEDMDEHAALGAVVGFEPGSWTLVRFRLWRAFQSHFDRPGVQAYEVGHPKRKIRLCAKDNEENLSAYLDAIPAYEKRRATQQWPFLLDTGSQKALWDWVCIPARRDRDSDTF